MTAFIQPTPALLDRIEPEAGDVLKPNKHRNHIEFWPDWDYIASLAASTEAVVAALTLCPNGVPEDQWNRIIETHCPQTHAALAPHGQTALDVVTGKAPAVLIGPAAQLINVELGGYQVLLVPDFAAMTAEIIGELGAIPVFVDPED